MDGRSILHCVRSQREKYIEQGVISAQTVINATEEREEGRPRHVPIRIKMQEARERFPSFYSISNAKLYFTSSSLVSGSSPLCVRPSAPFEVDRKGATIDPFVSSLQVPLFSDCCPIPSLRLTAATLAVTGAPSLPSTLALTSWDVWSRHSDLGSRARTGSIYVIL